MKQKNGENEQKKIRNDRAPCPAIPYLEGLYCRNYASMPLRLYSTAGG